MTPIVLLELKIQLFVNRKEANEFSKMNNTCYHGSFTGLVVCKKIVPINGKCLLKRLRFRMVCCLFRFSDSTLK